MFALLKGPDSSIPKEATSMIKPGTSQPTRSMVQVRLRLRGFWSILATLRHKVHPGLLLHRHRSGQPNSLSSSFIFRSFRHEETTLTPRRVPLHLGRAEFGYEW